MYRKGVGGVLLNSDGLVFIGKRKNTDAEWQMPQGGIEGNETYEDAILREMQEEVGIDNFKILGSTPLLTYDLPIDVAKTLWSGKFVGQEQKWFFLQFLGKDSDININFEARPEFDDWKWINYLELEKLAVSFKKEIYNNIISYGINNKFLTNY